MAKIWTARPTSVKPKPKPKAKPVAKTVAPNPLGPINFDAYKTQSASVQDIGNKYGIDYTREYAKRQAEAEAQAKRLGLQNQSKQVDLGVKNAQDAMSRDYFQKGLETAQGNVNAGMNQGLANEANLRLSMNRQAQMGDVFRQANQQKNEIQQNLTSVESARLAQEEQIYQERLAQAVAMIQQDRSLDQNEKQALLQAALQQRGQDIDVDQFGQQMNWDKYQFNNMSATDKKMLEWDQYQFNNVSAADKESNKIAWAQLAEEKRQFNSEAEWREYTFNNMSAEAKATLNDNISARGEEFAWRQYELEYTSEMALAEAQVAAGGDYLDFLP